VKLKENNVAQLQNITDIRIAHLTLLTLSNMNLLKNTKINEVKKSQIRFVAIKPIALILACFLCFSQANSITLPTKSFDNIDIKTFKEFEETMDKDPRLAALRMEKILKEFYKTAYKNSAQENFPDPDTASPLRDKGTPKSAESIVKEFIKAPQHSFFITQAPNLFTAHHMLAKAYEKNKDYLEAGHHYITALRYRTLKLTPKIWTNRRRLELAQAPKSERDMVSDYLKKEQQIGDEINSYRETVLRTHAEEDNMNDDPSNSHSAIRKIIEKNKVIREEAKQKFLKAKSDFSKAAENYKAYERQHNAESADFLVELSELFYTLDESIRDRNKIANYKEQYNSSYNYTFFQDWRKKGRHRAYLNSLEVAAQLDRTNPRTTYKMGVQYKKNGEVDRSTGAFLKTLEYEKNADDAKKLRSNEKFFTYIHLGGLYKRIKKYVNAAYYYENALKMSETGDCKAPIDIRINTATLHVLHTGNFLRAKQLLEELKKEPANENEEGSFKKIPENSSDPDNLKFDENDGKINSSERKLRNSRKALEIEILLIQTYKKLKERKNLMKSLSVAKSMHEDIEENIVKEKIVLKKSYKTLLYSKKKMTKTRSSKATQEYYGNLKKYRKIQTKISDMIIFRNRMNLKKIYFTLAAEQERDRLITEALQTYRDAEGYGIASDEARRQIRRIREQNNIR